MCCGSYDFLLMGQELMKIKAEMAYQIENHVECGQIKVFFI